VSWGTDLLKDEALTACMTAVPMVVSLIICNNGLFPSLFPHLSTQKPAHFRATHIHEKTTSEMLKTSS